MAAACAPLDRDASRESPDGGPGPPELVDLDMKVADYLVLVPAPANLTMLKKLLLFPGGKRGGSVAWVHRTIYVPLTRAATVLAEA